MNILITGGSRGIGAAAVRLFCARGDSVWFLYEKRHEQAGWTNSQKTVSAVIETASMHLNVCRILLALPAP